MTNAKKILAAVLLCTQAIMASADEGMWMINSVPKTTSKAMKEMGLRLTPKQIYSETGASLKNTVVMFGDYCTGVVVSPSGLLMTNHHCGFESIQKTSATNHNYIDNGFSAKSMDEEIPVEGLTVSFLIRVEDVSKAVIKAAGKEPTEYAVALAIDSIQSIHQAKIKKADPTLHCEIIPYYDGSQFFMQVYRTFFDVRLAFAPPSCVGKFGGETDNWMWPRQTGDFSVFRIYADENGKPAPYSESNKPLSTAEYAHISIDGYAPNDFCMTIGFPGQTQRYLSSFGIQDLMVNDYPSTVSTYRMGLDIIKSHMAKDEATKIRYSAKYDQISNQWKNTLGMMESVRNLKIIDKKKAIEARVQQWAATNSRGKAYIEVLPQLEKTYSEVSELNNISNFFINVLSVPDLPTIMQSAMGKDLKGDSDEENEAFRRDMKYRYECMDTAIDCQLLAAGISAYREHIASMKDKARYTLDFDSVIDSAYGGDVLKYVRHIYQTSAYSTYEGMLTALENDTAEIYRNDAAINLMLSIISKIYDFRDSMGKRQELISRNEQKFGEAIRTMNAEDKDYYADANFTMRMSYGTVGGYSPTPSVNHSYYSEPSELIRKQQTGKEEYIVRDDILSLLKGQQFGKYKDSRTGQMQLCFLTNNDITGGNSGSPMFNGKGELIGLAFDGNWESISGDIAYDSQLQRCIGVDIRYALFLMEKWGGCKTLLSEMNIKE